VTAGFPPETFGRQTPRSFQAAMAGVGARVQAEAENDIARGWQVGRFVLLGQAGKLKSLKHYLPHKPAAPQRSDDMLAALRTMGAGTDMTITQIKMEGGT
jgi:hypothetical protein